jgi:hypothetical protein
MAIEHSVLLVSAALASRVGSLWQSIISYCLAGTGTGTRNVTIVMGNREISRFASFGPSGIVHGERLEWRVIPNGFYHI